MAFISDQGKCRSQQNRSLPEIFNVAVTQAVLRGNP